MADYCEDKLYELRDTRDSIADLRRVLNRELDPAVKKHVLAAQTALKTKEREMALHEKQWRKDYGTLEERIKKREKEERTAMDRYWTVNYKMEFSENQQGHFPGYIPAYTDEEVENAKNAAALEDAAIKASGLDESPGEKVNRRVKKYAEPSTLWSPRTRVALCGADSSEENSDEENSNKENSDEENSHKENSDEENSENLFDDSD